MPSGEVVDPTKDPVNRLWRFFLQIGIPILGVILVVVVVVGVTFHSYRSTKAGIARLTHVILNTEQSRISQEVISYLSPATTGSNLVADMLNHIPSEYETGMFYTYVMSTLRQSKQLQSFYLADADGNFMMIERVVDQPNAIRVVRLKPDSKGGQFVIEYKTLDGKTLKTSTMPANAYDARERGWYKSAIQNKKLTWSSPALMPSKKGLVITASMPFVNRDGKHGVFATNISLQNLTSFLSTLNISKNAQAIIVNREGNIIASPGLMLRFGDKNWTPETNKINPDFNPALARAYDQYLVHGAGIQSFKMKVKQSSDKNTDNLDGNYIGISSQLPETLQKWVVLIVIPDKDFSGFVVTGGKQNLLFSLLIVALAAGMAGLLIYQSHRMERLRRRFKDVEDIAEKENNAIEMIASKPEVFDPTNEALMLTEGLCSLVSARRVSIWHLSENEKSLICNDVYDYHDGNHAGGLQYSHLEIASFLKALQDGEMIEVDNAAEDPRTADLYRLFMSSVGTHSLCITPVLGKDRIIGAVLIEDTPYIRRVRHISKIFAGLVAIRFIASKIEINTQDVHHTSEIRTEPLSHQQMMQNLPDDITNKQSDTLSEFLIQPGTHRYNHIQFEDLKASDQQGIYPHVAVMNITLSSYALSTMDRTVTLIPYIEDLVVVLQDIAKKYGLFYVKIMGGHLIAVAGCTKEPDVTAPIRLAHAALDMRLACIEAIPDMNSDAYFGIGIDVGPAIGSWFGKEQKAFNIWGPTVGMAALMSDMARDGGTIQVTEEAYHYLKNDFLFRPRGSFFVPKVGISNIFILAGRR